MAAFPARKIQKLMDMMLAKFAEYIYMGITYALSET